MKRVFYLFLLVLPIFFMEAAHSQSPNIVESMPTQNELHVAASTDISVTFDIDMDGTTFDNSTFVVIASLTGYHQGTFGYNAPTKTVTFNPDYDFDVGEIVSVTLTTGIESSGVVPLSDSYAWSFIVSADESFGVFGLPTSYLSDGMTESITAADLDMDGDIDLATTSSETSTVSVFLNKGGGSFDFCVEYNIPEDVKSIITADLNGDGYLELVTVHEGCWGYISILWNNGDGTFPSRLDVQSYSCYVQSITAADFDGDGDIDLATANNHSSNCINVYLNDGDGTSFSDDVYDIEVATRSICSADLDGDGYFDLAVIDEDDYVQTLLNFGDGTFDIYSDWCGVGDDAQSIITADFDGDGSSDLATISHYYNYYDVNVLLNDGSGNFSSYSSYDVGPKAKSAYASDLDGDGNVDIVTANYSATNVSVLNNYGDGSFAPADNYRLGGIPDILMPLSIFAADLDGDGDNDLAMPNYLNSGTSIVFNLDQNAFVSPRLNSQNIPNYTKILVAFGDDMDEATINNSSFIVSSGSSGLIDGVISYNASKRIATFSPITILNPGEMITAVITPDIESMIGIPLAKGFSWSFMVGVFAGSGEFSPYSAYASNNSPFSVYAFDLDNDNEMDLVTGRDEDYPFIIHHNDGNGDFVYSDEFSSAGTYGPSMVISADLDLDGYPDIAVSNNNTNNVSVFLNDGYGDYSSSTDYTVAEHPWSICASDLDGDGYPDLITSSLWTHNITILWNDAGYFTSSDNYSIAGYSYSVVSADVDNDGDIDLVAGNTTLNGVSILYNDGFGTFSSLTQYSIGELPVALIAEDFNGDRNIDLATANPEADNISILLNNGSGNFSSSTNYMVGNYPVSLSAADFDNDNDLDLVIANRDDDNLYIYLNDGYGNFTYDQNYPTEYSPFSVITADLDENGTMDLACTNVEANSITIFLSGGDFVCGDVDNNGLINILDIIYIINYKYKGGPVPISMEAADVNSDELINILDIIYLINYKYKGGPEPFCP